MHGMLKQLRDLVMQEKGEGIGIAK